MKTVSLLLALFALMTACGMAKDRDKKLLTPEEERVEAEIIDILDGAVKADDVIHLKDGNTIRGIRAGHFVNYDMGTIPVVGVKLQAAGMITIFTIFDRQLAFAIPGGTQLMTILPNGQISK